jgi:peptidyl-prolyl cis-trans isomerase C
MQDFMQFIVRHKLLLAGSFLFFLACAGKQDDNRVLAQVGERKLTMQEFHRAMPGLQQEQVSQLQKENYIKRWIETELLYQEAVRKGLAKSPEMTERMQTLQQELLATAFAEQYIYAGVTVSDQEISEFYEQSKSEFSFAADAYHVFLLMLPSPQKAQEVRTRLLQGEAWSGLARSFSIDPSQSTGGDCGFVSIASLPASLSKAVPTLKLNDISYPIKTEIGHAILKVSALQRKGEVQSLGQVQELLRARLLMKKREEAYRKCIAELSEKVELKTDYTALTPK